VCARRWLPFTNTIHNVSRATFRLNPIEGSLILLTINDGDATMNPAFSRVNRSMDVLYACTESVEENGSIVSWKVDTESGRLTRIGCADAQGTSTCYVTLGKARRNALVVNYWNATIVSYRIFRATRNNPEDRYCGYGRTNHLPSHTLILRAGGGYPGRSRN
jgi:6-phosphogluconolactonase (cycloisomerase 2 family)